MRSRKIFAVLLFITGFSLCLSESWAQQGIFADDFESGTACAWSRNPHNSSPTFSVNLNPSYRQILQSESECERIEYFGQKSSNGLAVDVDAVLVETPGDAAILELDDHGRPITISMTNNGTVLGITWLTMTSIIVTATSPNGEIQVNVMVDLNDPKNLTVLTASHVGKNLVDSNLEPRGGIPVGLVNTPLDYFKTSHPRTVKENALENKATSPSRLFVERCSNPVDAVVTSMTITSSGGTMNIAGARKLGPGQFEYDVPTFGSEAGEDLEEVCESVAGALGAGCTWFVVPAVASNFDVSICLAIAALIDFILGGPTGEAVAINSGCLAGFRAARIYCITAGASPSVGAPSVLEIVCGGVSEAVDIVAGPEVTLTAKVTATGVGTFTEAKTASSLGPFPSFNFILPAEADIDRLTASPPDPAPFESYVATALIVCAPPNTVVEMTIVGTDGYADSTSCLVEGNATCSLSVPGADAGVVDTVTVSLGGGGSSKTIVLVF